MSRVEVRMTGYGGQGVVTLGKLVATTASKAGRKVTAAVDYSGEVRGGASWVDVVIDDEEVDYPLGTVPDVLVLLSQEAATTFGKTVKEGGLVFYDPCNVSALSTIETAKVFAIPATKVAQEELKSGVVANLVMFGALVRLSGILTQEMAEIAMESVFPKERLDFNKQAFRCGLKLAKSLSEGGFHG